MNGVQRLKTVPEWPKTTLLQRLKDCRMMLLLSEVLTEGEAKKVADRIKKLEEQLK